MSPSQHERALLAGCLLPLTPWRRRKLRRLIYTPLPRVRPRAHFSYTSPTGTTSTEVGEVSSIYIEGQTIEPGIRYWHGKFQVRVAPFEAESYDTLREAQRARLDLLDLRDEGYTFRPIASKGGGSGTKLGPLVEAFMADKRATGGKHADYGLAPSSERGWQQKTGYWVERFGADRILETITAAEVRHGVLDLHAKHPAKSVNALQGIKALWRFAMTEGARLDGGVLALKPPKAKRQRAIVRLTPAQASFLVESARTAFPKADDERGEQWARFLRLLVTGAYRVSELLYLHDGELDLASRTIDLPAERTKTRERKLMAVSLHDADLLGEQRAFRPPHARHLFPRPSGTPWQRGRWYEDVWAPIVEHAKVEWLRRYGGRTTPFDGLVAHHLRHTGITLMQELGLGRDVVRAQVGHASDKQTDHYTGARIEHVRRSLDQVGGDLLGAALAVEAAA